MNKYVCIKKHKQAHHEGLVTICYNVNNGYLWRRKVMAGFYSFFVLFSVCSTVLQSDYFCCFVLTELIHYYKVAPYYLEHCVEK